MTAFFTGSEISNSPLSFITFCLVCSCGIVSLSHQRLDSEYLALLLSEKYGFATRGGLHCAPLAHAALGTADGGLLRVSFGHDNDEKEVDALLFALNELNNNF